MKQTGIMLKMAEDKLSIEEGDHPIGKPHIGFSPDTPLRKDAFDLTGLFSIMPEDHRFRKG